MVIECLTCGDWHPMTPTAMAVVILAYQRGEMQTVNVGGIDNKCMADAFDNKELVSEVGKRYPGNGIKFAIA